MDNIAEVLTNDCVEKSKKIAANLEPATRLTEEQYDLLIDSAYDIALTLTQIRDLEYPQ